MMSPMPAYRRLEPPSTLMHITSLAPELSATSRWLCIWIMVQPPLFGRARDDLGHAPVLGLRHRCDLHHPDDVAFVAAVVGVVGVELARAADVLAVQRVLDLALAAHRHRLVRLVSDHAAFHRALTALVRRPHNVFFGLAGGTP